MSSTLRQVKIQLASLIVASFVSTDHIDSEEKNARVALLAGFSIGLGKHVLVLQQEPSAEILDLGSVSCQFEAEDQLQDIIDAWIKKQGQIVATQAPRTNPPIGEPSDPIAVTPEPIATPQRCSGLLQSDSVVYDREALIAFYNSTSGANWKNSTNWLSDKPMGEWFGVTTNEDGRVTKLHLRGNSLSGGITAKLGRPLTTAISWSRNQQSKWNDSAAIEQSLPPARAGSLSEPVNRIDSATAGKTCLFAMSPTASQRAEWLDPTSIGQPYQIDQFLYPTKPIEWDNPIRTRQTNEG